VFCVSALQAKQNSELVGRSVSLRTTRPGRIESNTAKDSGTSGAAKDSEAAESADLVLMGECAGMATDSDPGVK
jgi:hypothetical protein